MENLEIRPRIQAVDMLRGLVMIIMALDHVREFWSASPFRPEDLTQTSTALFFTRFVTHFCAPVFVFLSGVSIYFTEQRLKDKRSVAVLLLKRGVWLVLVQVTALSFLMQFAYNMIILEVIWAIGWSMVIMAVMIWLPRKVLTAIAIVMIGGHNLLPSFAPVTASNLLLAVLHNSPGVMVVPGFPVVIIAYSIVPWVGVMAAGYLMGIIFSFSAEKQTRYWRTTGLLLIALFVGLRLLNIYGDSVQWSFQERGGWYTFLSFLNVTKYPPSLLFLSLTLGIAMIVLTFIGKLPEQIASVLKTFGRVPFFYYLIHVPLIVLGAYLWGYFQFGTIVSFAFQSPDQWPEGYTPSIFRTYLVWIIYIMIL
ncbi:MAG: heparan-alpha-glucosaminide N-acetyltransferase domain-containing protein, partial [Chryseolinea sp.]